MINNYESLTDIIKIRDNLLCLSGTSQNKDKLLSLLFKSCKKEYDNQYNLKKSYIEQNPFKVNHDVIKQKLQELEDNYNGEREDYQVCAVFDLCDYLMDDPKSSYFTDYN